MSLFVASKLVPLPESIVSTYVGVRNYLRSPELRVALAPHSNFAFNMNLRGLFDGVNIQGALDMNPAKRGEVVYGLEAIDAEDILSRGINVIVIVDPRYSNDIHEYLLSASSFAGIKVINLCKNYTVDNHRSDIVRGLKEHVYDLSDYRSRDGVSPLDNIQVPINPRWGLGDKLCALTAARHVARLFSNSRVWFPALREVQDFYADSLVCYGTNGFVLRDHYELFHRQKEFSPALNYLGCYLLGLAIDFQSPPALELPEIPPFKELIGVKYIALQPTSNWAQPNLSLDSLCRVIAESPFPVMLASSYSTKNGNQRTDADLEINRKAMERMVSAGANASFIGNEVDMLRLIRHSHLVVTPRSASAHIAAGYRKMSVIWLPNDGENWHMNYPEWCFSSTNLETHGSVDSICESIRKACYQ